MAVRVSDRVSQFLALRWPFECVDGAVHGRDGRQVDVGQQGVAVAKRAGPNAVGLQAIVPLYVDATRGKEGER